jgi:glycosyltransferase involved in cell wall biosynthesis
VTSSPIPAGLRLTILTSWRERGRWYLLCRLRQAGLKVTVLGPWFSGGPRPLARLSVWLSRFYLPLWLLLRPGRQEAVAAWNLPYSLVLGLLRRLAAPLGRQPLCLARDFHIDPTRAGEPAYALRLRLLALALPGIDTVLTTSRAEAADYAALFHRPPGQFRFFPDEPASELFDIEPRPCAGHVFAYGLSDRDFDTLVTASAGLDAPVVVLSKAYVPAVPVPPNVRLIGRYVSREEYLRLLATAACCVVPLKDDRVAAGQNSMFEAMALARPLVISRNVAALEYVVHGENALLYRTGDAEDLAVMIRTCLDHPEEAEAMARRGQQSARDWLERAVDMFLEALGDGLGHKRSGAKGA